MKFTLLHSCVLSSLALFSACGSEVQDLSLDPAPTTGAPDSGVFVNRVEGLEYTRTFAPVVQTTSVDSTYSYRIGEPIMFHIGNLEIGEALGLSILTPKDIVAYKNLDLDTSINANEVNNRVRVLMSLDEDSDPTNGLKISDATRQLAKNWSTPDYNLAESAFSNELKSSTGTYFDNKPITTKDAARVHFESALRCVYSGAYNGNWILPNGNKSGFVGVMIQSNGTIVTLGDGQDLNGDELYEEFLFARGTHYMDDGYYDFNETGEFNITSGSIVPSNKIVKGDGESQGYNRVVGSFEQTNPETNATEVGSYEASRVGNGDDVAYRYTGYGYNNPSSSENPQTDPIIGLFTFDINRDGTVFGMIHDARNNEEPALIGDMNFTTGSIDMNLTYSNGDTYLVNGVLNFNGTVNLDWSLGGTKLGYIAGVGCQLQPHY